VKPLAAASFVTAPSDHFDGVRFFNLRGARGQSLKQVPEMLRERRTPWPAHVPVVPQQPPVPATDDEIVVTFVGHSTFLIQTTAGNILTDPVFVDRASPLSFIGPRRVRQPGVRFEDLPPIALVLLSHNHYDHCDLKTLSRLHRRFRPRVVTLLKNAPLLATKGITAVEELDWWQPASRSPLPVVATPAQHFSARTPFDRNRALWGGFVVQLGHRRLFFAGDSGYGPHFREIGQRLGPIHTALLPIGAYEPRWFMRPVHMNPEEAVVAHLDLGAVSSIGMHFGTFRLTSEGIDDPVTDLAAARLAAGLAEDQFRTLGFGESQRIL
jgi:L-ascorbate metabolism protein UlaG (beta-lactamase superfamily)